MSDIIHLHGNLYRVKRELIEYAEGEITIDSSDSKFHNPRRLNVSGKVEAKGFSKAEMTELREKIRTIGLNHPLMTRKKGDKLELIDGERRKRCIDKLVKDNSQCFNPATGEMLPASEMYEYVEVRISEMDDKQAYHYAFVGNETSVHIGEAATTSLIKYWRLSGWTDKEILDITGKSISWLRDTDFIIGLDEITFTAFVNDEINRSAALDLSKIESVSERHKRLNKAKEFAEQRIASLREKLEEKVLEAEENVKLAEQEATETIFSGGNKAAATIKVAKARKKANRATEAKHNFDKKVRVGTNDIRNAIDKDKLLTINKIQKHWYTDTVDAIKLNCCDVEGIPLGIDEEDARLVVLLIENGIQKGEKEIVSLLQQHKKNKERRSK